MFQVNRVCVEYSIVHIRNSNLFSISLDKENEKVGYHWRKLSLDLRYV